MRKIFGGFLGLTALVFLGLAYARMAHAADEPCAQEMARKIEQLIAEDKSDVLQLQLQLTALKLARVTYKDGNKTIEKYIEKQSALVDAADKTREVRENLVSLYRRYDGSIDEATVVARYEETIAKAKAAKYKNLATRFTNKDLSAFVLAHTRMNPPEARLFGPVDGAILWLQSELSEAATERHGRGSAEANSLELSSQVLRLTGGVTQAEARTAEEMDAEITDVEKKIAAEMDRIEDLFRDDLKKSCAKIANCAECRIDAEDKQNALLNAMAPIMQRLQSDPELRARELEKALSRFRKTGLVVSLGKNAEMKIEPLAVTSKPRAAVEETAASAVMAESAPAEGVVSETATISNHSAGKSVMKTSPTSNTVSSAVELIPGGKASKPREAQEAPAFEVANGLGNPVSLSFVPLDGMSKKGMNALVDPEKVKAMKPDAKGNNAVISLGRVRAGECVLKVTLEKDVFNSYYNTVRYENTVSKEKGDRRFAVFSETNPAEKQSLWQVAQRATLNEDIRKACPTVAALPAAPSPQIIPKNAVTGKKTKNVGELVTGGAKTDESFSLVKKPGTYSATLSAIPGAQDEKALKKPLTEDEYMHWKKNETLQLGTLNVGNCVANVGLFRDEKGAFANRVDIKNEKSGESKGISYTPAPTAKPWKEQSAWAVMQKLKSHQSVLEICGTK